MITPTKLKRFQDNVLIKYQIYNSIFTTLPFDSIRKTGVLLPLFADICENSFEKGMNPTEIVKTFFKKYYEVDKEIKETDLLFRFVQYIEREIVLFDAIEETAFPLINNMDGIGSIRNIKEKAISEGLMNELRENLKSSKIRVVLTAHPTQFYPGNVLAIITDLGKYIEQEDYVMTKKLLAQLGKTPFFKYNKPTPYDEAVRLIWFLENIFYHTISDIYEYISDNIFEGDSIDNPILEVGFWPGGDRDGNPFVTTDITLKVARRLRHTLLKNYHKDFRELKRRLTFRDVTKSIAALENKVYKSVLNPNKTPEFSANSLIVDLEKIKQIIIDKHQSLFVDKIEILIHKIKIFGLHFASLDIRQDSSVHDQIFESILEQYPKLLPKDYILLTEKQKLKILSELDTNIEIDENSDTIVSKTIGSMKAIKIIQEKNGEKSVNRYIISNTQNSLHVMKVFTMLKLSTFPKELPVDVVPLFETVEDLKNAGSVMELLYTNHIYMNHLKFRNNKQTIMLGFSDGTKDGGYLMANWSIYKAKENLTAVARKYGIEVVFFDGRGGPPARGGGKTHQFYASLGKQIEHDEIQLTIQGQTISSKFGSLPSAQYNLEQLLSAGVENSIFYDRSNDISDTNRSVMNDLANLSYNAYVDFKNHPKFLPYLEKMSTLKYYGQTNIGSRPSKRNQTSSLVFSDLRAIPYVGSWSQLKQNVPGFYGVGTALKKYEDDGTFDKVQKLYQDSDFFKALIENSMMSLTKSFFSLTSYMKNNKEFGEFWLQIFTEYKTTKRLLLKLTGQEELMENYPDSKASIESRDRIVLPLLTIQQYALQRIQKLKESDTPDEKLIKIYEKLVVRSLYGNINASRNSA